MNGADAPRQIGVVVSTYNAPASLDKALRGFAQQNDHRFEVLVADDGSGPETREVVERRREDGLTIHHVWHEDRGFRKCEILNQAIKAASSDYLIFTDGDCIPRKDFVSIHRSEAQVGCFLSGTYNNLPQAMGDKLTHRAIASGDAFDYRWLRRHGMPFSKQALRLTKSRLLAETLNSLTTTRPNWNGCNASAWRSDILKANGFDERMRYGGEDREFGFRLENAGVTGKLVRFKAICLHVDHERGYVNQEDLQRNLSIRQASQRMRITSTPHGIRRAA